MLASIDKVLAKGIRSLFLTHFGEVEATERLISQLKQSIIDQAALALSEKGAPQGRVDRLQGRIFKLFMAALRADGKR